MQLSQSGQDVFVPDGTPLPAAVVRTTHLAVGAHADDVEFMALHGILECFRREDRWFGAVTCTDGAGSARSGHYAGWENARMAAVRVEEQRAAAGVGAYGFAVQLAHPSAAAKEPGRRDALVDDLVAILSLARPECVYTHNPFDKHPTHLGVLRAVLQAIRLLPPDQRPARLIGCEVWRGLDWLPAPFKLTLPVDSHPNLAAALNGVHDSQISGGKRYDLAVEGRRRANATFFDSHTVDDARRVDYGIDLGPLLAAGGPAPEDFAGEILQSFREEILGALAETADPS